MSAVFSSPFLKRMSFSIAVFRIKAVLLLLCIMHGISPKSDFPPESLAGEIILPCFGFQGPKQGI